MVLFYLPGISFQERWTQRPHSPVSLMEFLQAPLSQGDLSAHIHHLSSQAESVGAPPRRGYNQECSDTGGVERSARSGGEDCGQWIRHKGESIMLSLSLAIS